MAIIELQSLWLLSNRTANIYFTNISVGHRLGNKKRWNANPLYLEKFAREREI